MYFCNKITIVTMPLWGAVTVIQREIGLSGTQTATTWGDQAGGQTRETKTEMKPVIYKTIGSAAKWTRYMRGMTGSDVCYDYCRVR
jgi:hypothetical protein